jgi:iron(III) transport system substrate-binding protein
MPTTPRPSRRLAGLVAATAVALVGVAGCSSDEDVLTIYSGRQLDLIGPILERFAEERGVDIEVREGTTAELALLVEEEGDRSPADVFISQSPGAVAYLDGAGRLQELPGEVLDAVPADDRAPDGEWVGLTGRVRTLVYNPELIDEADLPASVLDLVDPRYDGQLAVAPGNASFQDFVTGLRGELGDEQAGAFLEGLAGNDALTFPNNVAILDAVNRGEIAMGLINHYYWFEHAVDEPDQPAQLHFFGEGDLGSMLLVTAASVLDTADDPELANELVAFLLGEEAQRYFAEETLEYPLAAGVEPVEGLFPLDEIVSARIDFDTLGSLDETISLIRASGLE